MTRAPQRAFVSGYPTRGARAAAIASALAGFIGALLAAATGKAAFGLICLPALVGLERAKLRLSGAPVLQLDRRGFSLAGLGRLPWSAIRTARLVERAGGGRLGSWLLVELQGDAEDLLAEPSRARLGALGERAWRPIGPRGLIVRLHALEDPPESVREALQRFWGRRVPVDRS